MTALEVIQQSPSDFHFYLGGSRRMAELVVEKKSPVPIFISDTTDHDYYATWSSEIATYLMQNEFQESYFSNRQNNRSHSAYECDTEVEEIFYRDNVQVVLHKDASLYYNIFENIDPEFYTNYLWKSGPSAPIRIQITDIFNALYRAYHSKGN